MYFISFHAIRSGLKGTKEEINHQAPLVHVDNADVRFLFTMSRNKTLQLLIAMKTKPKQYITRMKPNQEFTTRTWRPKPATQTPKQLMTTKHKKWTTTRTNLKHLILLFFDVLAEIIDSLST